VRKKDHIKDYATAAFRFYKTVGGVKAYKDKLWSDALAVSQKSGILPNAFGDVGISKPTEADIMRAQRAVDDAYAAVSDLEAVERTLDIIARLGNGLYIKKALEYVYFPDADKPLERGDIQARVHRAEIHIPASERTVYYYLSQARRFFAVERGLRI